MRGRIRPSGWRIAGVGLVALLIGGRAWAQERSTASSASGRSNDAKPVVRTFGTQGGFRTEVTSRTIGKMSEEDRRQEVDQMLQEIDQLEAQLRQEGTGTVTQEQRTRQGGTLTRWWDRINSWFRRHI